MASSSMDRIQVKGNSMQPFLVPGDQVGVHWVNTSERPLELRPGDIVIARESDASIGESPNWIIHRVIRSKPAIWTRGDAALVSHEVKLPEIWARVQTIGEHPFRVGLLDRAIAALSAAATPPRSLRARALRKSVFVLGWIRRQTLARRIHENL